jgi:hypothetical protein
MITSEAMTDPVKRAEELLNEPPPDNGAHGSLDEEEIVSLVRDLIVEVKALREERDSESRWAKQYHDEAIAYRKELTSLREVAEKVRKDCDLVLTFMEDTPYHAGLKRQAKATLSLLPKVT